MVESYNHDFSVLSMPYLFEDSDHQREAYTNGMLDELFDSTEEYDFKMSGHSDLDQEISSVRKLSEHLRI